MKMTSASFLGGAWIALALILGGASSASAQTKLLRFPDIHGDQVVFTYAGDLWTAKASKEGARAVRLTADEGLEQFAKFSPDGQWIAFTGQYDGDEQVYVIPNSGGVPKQLTFYPATGPLPPRWGYDNQVYGWTEGGEVLFRSLRYGFDLTMSRLYTVAVDGGLPVPLKMPVSGAGDIEPGGKRVVYSPLVRDFRSWKRYEGGWAQDLHIFDLETGQTSPVTKHPRSDRDPMWIGNQIYFASDRDGKLNLYAFDVSSKQIESLTKSDTWDVRWPSRGDQGQIVFEFGGELEVYDTRNKQRHKLSITVPDDGLHSRPSRLSAASLMEDFALSPKGERVVVSARGDVFSVPVEKGPTHNLTQSSGSHEKSVAWSPDGRKIAYLSDESGEEEIYWIDYDGRGKPEALTQGGEAMRFGLSFSPDGKHLAYSDKDGRLYVLTLDGGKQTLVADDPIGFITDSTWSPCSGYLAMSVGEPSQFRSIHIWSSQDGSLQRVTSTMFNEFEPVWDPEGNYLYYLTDREFAPQIGSFEWNYVGDRESVLVAMALRKDVAHPFPPEMDEVTVETKDDEKSEGEESSEDDSVESEDVEPMFTQIDFEGIEGRVARVPVDAGNYSGLTAVDGALFYAKSSPFYYGRASDGQPSLMKFDLKARKESVFVSNFGGYTLSQDGKKILASQGGQLKLHDVSGGTPKTVSTQNMYVHRDPKQEWNQIFHEVWRRFRDYFYASNMHGYDWEGLRDQYATWLDHVAHRSDLNYVISEMIGELNASHAYISGGDFEIPARAAVALPGAEFELDPTSGRYRIVSILKGHNEEPKYRSPMTEIGVDVSVGDYVLAIDGKDLTANTNPYHLLRDKADRPVRLLVNGSPETEGAREVSFRPLRSESALRYFQWVEGCRAKVDAMSEGRIGYLHIPDMGGPGIYEFIKWFYGQVRKQGLIVDVRYNGGGNVSPMIIERLRRQLVGYDFARTWDVAETAPSVVFTGPMVCLLNQSTASDGDQFADQFRRTGLGPLIGKRSWGGVVGITNRGMLIDGGTVNVPEFGSLDPEGQWTIEGYGVDPDIEVENEVVDILAGRDSQLERGVAEILKAIEAEYKPLPKRPANLDKSR